MLGFVIITVNLDYAKLNPYYSIPTIICGEPEKQKERVIFSVTAACFRSVVEVISTFTLSLLKTLKNLSIIEVELGAFYQLELLRMIQINFLSNTL
jgi:hypothetical protein